MLALFGFLENYKCITIFIKLGKIKNILFFYICLLTVGGGAIAGIVISLLIVIALVVVLAVLLQRGVIPDPRKRPSKSLNECKAYPIVFVLVMK